MIQKAPAQPGPNEGRLGFCERLGHGPVMDRTTYSPREAARIVGCGRSSIMRALTSGELKAVRDNRNSWKIAREDLLAWSSDRTEPARSGPDLPTDRPDAGPPDRLADQLADAEKRAAVAEARLSDAIADRDHWRALASRLSEPRPGIIDRLGQLFRR